MDPETLRALLESKRREWNELRTQVNLLRGAGADRLLAETEKRAAAVDATIGQLEREVAGA